MQPELLINTFPRLYHMADKDAWPGICKHGLLSTTALLDLFEVVGANRDTLESARRPESVTINHVKHGKAVIRDQKPMDDQGLLRCLDGFTPAEWYRLLNRKTFFWLNEDRLLTLLNARAYRNKRHCILTVDTREMVDRNVDRINLCPMNSGCTKPMPFPRGMGTFLPIQNYPFEEWLRKRRYPQKSVVELAVDYFVPNIAEITVRAEIRDRNGQVELLFER